MGWEQFVNDYKIPHREGSAGQNIEVHCPFCGHKDKSFHLTLHKDSTMWACWRNREQEKGRYPARVIKALLKCTTEQATLLTEAYFDNIKHFRQQSSRICKYNELEIPQDFIEFKTSHDIDLLDAMQKPYLDYLVSRDLIPEFVTSRFDLKWAISGAYASRIIIPQIYLDKWWSWTGRAIHELDPLRYKACTANAPDMFLFDYDNLQGGDALFITEGTFDAMKIACCFLPNVSGTALVGKNLTTNQLRLIVEMQKIYAKIFLVYDKTAYAESIATVEKIRLYAPNVKAIQPQFKDFGSTPLVQLKTELQSYL